MRAWIPFRPASGKDARKRRSPPSPRSGRKIEAGRGMRELHTGRWKICIVRPGARTAALYVPPLT